MEDIRKVVGFDSVEEFWGLYNNIVPPSQLPGKANYYLFRVSLSCFGPVILQLTSRMISCQHGRTQLTRMVESGLFNYREKSTGLQSIRCGYTP
jgi:hypothetical protein